MNSGSTRVLAAIGVALAGYGVGAVLLLSSTISNWLAPWEPLLFAGLGLTALVTLCVGMVDLTLTQGANSGLPTQRIVTMVAAVGLIPALAGSAWTLPGMRLKGVEHLMGRQDFPGLQRALADREHSVRLRACVLLVQAGREEDEPAILSGMNDSYELARDCLAQTTQTPRGQELAVVVTARLYSLAMDNAATEPQRACEAVAMASSIASGPEVKGTAFLSCALTAEGAEVRDCCAKALQGVHPTGASLAGALSKAPGDLARLVPVMTRAAFVTSPAQDSDVQRAAALGLHGSEFRLAALRASCDMIIEPGDRREVLATMATAAEGLACYQPASAIPRAREAWRQICRDMAPDLAKAQDPAVLLCTQVRYQIVESAIQLAATIVASAIKAHEEADVASAIQVGYDAFMAESFSAEGFAQRLVGAAGGVSTAQGHGGGANMEIMRQFVGDNPQAMFNYAMGNAMGGNIVNIFDLFDKFEAEFNTDKLMELEAFQNLSDKERQEFTLLLEKYKAFKDDPAQRDRLAKLRSEFESRSEEYQSRLSEAAGQVTAPDVQPAKASRPPQER